MAKLKVFLDANIWFSAAMSAQGGSFLICHLAEEGLIQAVANKHVLDEAERNLLLKAPKKLSGYFALLAKTRPEVNNLLPNDDIVRTLGSLLLSKDIPVVFGALEARADFLVSLDKKHILQPKLKAFSWPFEIVSPKKFLEFFRTTF